MPHVAKYLQICQYLWKRWGKMLLKARNSQITICLLVMGLALATIFLPYQHRKQILSVVRVLQFVATVVLLFGILKAHPQHKANLMLFWLFSTAFFMFSLFLYAIIDIYSLSVWEYLFFITFSLTGTGAIGYMFINMYNQYVELTQVTVPQTSDVEAPTNEEPSKLNGQVTVLITHPKLPSKA